MQSVNRSVYIHVYIYLRIVLGTRNKSDPSRALPHPEIYSNDIIECETRPCASRRVHERAHMRARYASAITNRDRRPTGSRVARMVSWNQNYTRRYRNDWYTIWTRECFSKMHQLSVSTSWISNTAPRFRIIYGGGPRQKQNIMGPGSDSRLYVCRFHNTLSRAIYVSVAAAVTLGLRFVKVYFEGPRPVRSRVVYRNHNSRARKLAIERDH